MQGYPILYEKNHFFLSFSYLEKQYLISSRKANPAEFKKMLDSFVNAISKNKLMSCNENLALLFDNPFFQQNRHHFVPSWSDWIHWFESEKLSDLVDDRNNVIKHSNIKNLIGGCIHSDEVEYFLR